MPLQDPELEKLHSDRIAALKVRFFFFLCPFNPLVNCCAIW